MIDKKKFMIPEALVVTFAREDIIVTSADWGDDGNDNGEAWGPEIQDGEGGLE